MEQPLLVNDTVKSLVECNSILTQQLGAKQKRIEYLEMVLNQRHIETRRAFDPKKIEQSIEKVYLLWLEASPGTGFTYEEAEQEFFEKWRYHSASVPQRMRDLRQEGRLWSRDENGKVTFYLKLKGA